MTISTISPMEVFRLKTAGETVELIDVRMPVEYAEIHAEGARLAPLDQLDPAGLLAERVRKDAPLYVICKSGARAAKACAALMEAGCVEVISVEGGMAAWEAAGLPVVRGKKVMSLERQVRIAAGAVALAGAVLAWLVHPIWIGLSGFVGAGLIFAGVTDSCAMGLMLAKMPWNRR